jgi:hypothetical protein
MRNNDKKHMVLMVALIGSNTSLSFIAQSLCFRGIRSPFLLVVNMELHTGAISIISF